MPTEEIIFRTKSTIVHDEVQYEITDEQGQATPCLYCERISSPKDMVGCNLYSKYGMWICKCNKQITKPAATQTPTKTDLYSLLIKPFEKDIAAALITEFENYPHIWKLDEKSVIYYPVQKITYHDEKIGLNERYWFELNNNNKISLERCSSPVSIDQNQLEYLTRSDEKEFCQWLGYLLPSYIHAEPVEFIKKDDATNDEEN